MYFLSTHTNQNMCINKRLKKSIDVINNILCVCNRACGVKNLWAIFGININKLFRHNVIKKIIQNCQKLWHNNIMRARACEYTRLNPIISFYKKEYPKETHACIVYYMYIYLYRMDFCVWTLL